MVVPFIGRTNKPKKYPSPCVDPMLSIGYACKGQPWTAFIRLHTLWQCKHCGTVYRLEKIMGMDGVERRWVEYVKGKKAHE
jgi:hypothetical protein